MLVRLENTKDPNFLLVFDELDEYKGIIHLGAFFKYCLEKEETLEIDEYTYYWVIKEKINKYCKK